MNYSEIIREISELPPDQKQLVGYHILSSLNEEKRMNVFQLFNYQNDKAKNKETEIKKRNQREAGFLDGDFYMSDDFDAPLDDFKEYM